MAVDTGDDIVRLNAGFGGGRFRHHAGNDHAVTVFHSKWAATSSENLLGHFDSQVRPFDYAIAFQLLHDIAGRVVVTAMPTPSKPPDRLLMAELTTTTSPVKFTSGPPELPGINGRIRLDVVVVRIHVEVSTLGANDAFGDRPTKPNGPPNRQYAVADLGLAAIRETQEGQLAAGLDGERWPNPIRDRA